MEPTDRPQHRAAGDPQSGDPQSHVVGEAPVTDSAGPGLPVRGMVIAAVAGALVVLLAVGALRWLAPVEGSVDAGTSAASIATLLDEGIAAYGAGDLDGAEQAFAAAIAIDPENALAVFDLGTVRDARGDTAGARDLYARAVEIDPEFADAHFNLAVAQASLGDSGGAAISYQRTIELQPTRSAALWNLGLLLYDDGQLVDARALLNAAIALDPTLADRVPENVELA